MINERFLFFFEYYLFYISHIKLSLGRPDWGGVKIFLCSKKIFEPM